MTTTPQAALLREAAQNALTTLDGIANANPRDKKDTWCGYAEINLRQLIDSTLKEYKS